MKLKEANFLDLHAEKLAIGLGAAFVAYVVWAYVIGHTHQVELNGQPVPAAQVDPKLLDEAQRLQNRLDAPAHEALREFPVPDYAAVFRNRRQTPPTPPGDISDLPANMFAMGPTNLNRLRIGGERRPLPGERPYQPLSIPAPQRIVVRPGMGAIDLEAIAPARREPIVAAFGQRTPLDQQWVSLAAQLDLASIARQLQVDALEADRRSIPASLMAEAFAFVDVQVERRRVLGPDRYGEPEPVGSMPGRVSVRGNLAEVTLGNVGDMIGFVRQNRGEILQPTMYPLLNRQWVPPQFAIEMDDPARPDEAPQDEPAEVTDLRRQLRLAHNRVRYIQGQISRFTQANQPTPERLQRQLDQARQQAQEIEEQLQQAGVRTENPPPARPSTRPTTRPDGFAEFAPGVVDNDRPADEEGNGGPAQPTDSGLGAAGLTGPTLEVWAHDFDTQPGQTYQYRVRLIAANPLFGRRVPKEQIDLAKRFTLVGDWSDWSDPVGTPRMEYFFLTAAQQQVGRAQVEVWKFHGGLWRAAEFSVEPGDPIGRSTRDAQPMQPSASDDAAVTPMIDFSTGAVVVNLDFRHKLADADGLGLARTTLRMLYARADTLDARLEADDGARRDRLMRELELSEPGEAEVVPDPTDRPPDFERYEEQDFERPDPRYREQWGP